MSPASVSSGVWPRIGLRFIALLAVLLWPWSGLGERFATAFARVCDALVHVVSGDGAQIHFIATGKDPEHPWWVTMAVRNVFTGQSFGIPVDTRTVAYVRFAVFLALALAWPVGRTLRGLKAVALGGTLLVAVTAASVAIPLLQVLGMVKILGIGVLAQSVLSIGILTLVTYPGMAYAIPGLLWWLTLRLAESPPAAKACAKA